MESSVDRESEAVTNLNMEMNSSVGAKTVPGIDGAVDNVPGESLASVNDVNMTSTDDNGASQSADGPNESRSHVNGNSYASRAARTAGRNSSDKPTWRRPTNSAANDMPKRPRTALFTPSRSASARSVFEALSMAHIDASDIQCMQRKMNSEVVITFKSVDVKEKFLRLNALTVGGYSYATQDIDRPMTFLTIYDAPFELSDLAIIRRLAPFCEVVHYRRGKFDFKPGVYNGLRHYRVRVTKPVPSFIRFGKYQIFLKHDGQVPTCRRCNLAGHFSNDCNLRVCFNCENIGHEAGSCPAPPLCHFCKEDGHTSRECRYSWVSPLIRGTTTDESAPVNVDRSDGEDSEASFKTRSGDSFKWADDSDLSDEDEDDNDFRDAEAQPLAAALPVNTLPTDPPFFEPSENEPAATEPSTAELTVVEPSGTDLFAAGSSAADVATSILETSVPPTESPPDAQPNQTAENQASPADHQPDGVVDSQGFIKSPVVVIDDLSQPSDPQIALHSSASPNCKSRVPVPVPRFTRRTFAVAPEALVAAALRKATSPVVSGKPQTPAASSTPMETTADLKRKAQTQADAPPKERREKKKGRK